MSPIGIVGCGIGGLALAVALCQQGRPVVLFDQFDAPRPVGSGLVLQPVGLHVLNQIGCKAEILSLGAKITRMSGHESTTGLKVLDVTYDKTGVEYGCAIHRASLFDLLYRAALAAGAEIQHSAQITGRVGQRLVFADGSRSAPFDLIVDAAGAGSPLSMMKATALPYGAVWGTVPWVAGTSLPWDELRQCYRRASNMIGVLPLGQMPDDPTPIAAIFWSLPTRDIAAWQTGSIPDWQAEVARLWPEAAPFFAPITHADQMTAASYSHGQLRKPYSDGLVHIGDAAHRASPQLGQGANMALLDALALARAIDRSPLDLAGERYHRARRNHVWLYQNFSRAFTPMYQSDSRVLPWLRDRVLTPVSQTPPIPRVLSSLVRGRLAQPLGDLTHG